MSTYAKDDAIAEAKNRIHAALRLYPALPNPPRFPFALAALHYFNHRHFATGGYPYYYGNDCSWLRRYSCARYEACMGVY